MSWVLMVATVPAALLVLALVHDFFAALSDERLWSDPALQERTRP